MGTEAVWMGLGLALLFVLLTFGSMGRLRKDARHSKDTEKAD
jgi:hypothetical protein